MKLSKVLVVTVAGLGAAGWGMAANADAAGKAKFEAVCAECHEAGDFVDALEKGVFEWTRAVNLCDVVAGRAVGRSRPESITLFKSVGLALEDVALAARLLDLARAASRGVELPI